MLQRRAAAPEQAEGASLYDAPIGSSEWGGFLAVSAGLAGFLVAAHPTAGDVEPPLWAWIVTGAGVGTAVVVAGYVSQRYRNAGSAAVYGVAAARRSR